MVDIDETKGEIQLWYMKAVKPNTYEWPSREDHGWQKITEIVAGLKGPVLDDSSRGFFFRFTEDDMAQVKATSPVPYKLC